MNKKFLAKTIPFIIMLAFVLSNSVILTPVITNASEPSPEPIFYSNFQPATFGDWTSHSGGWHNNASGVAQCGNKKAYIKLEGKASVAGRIVKATSTVGYTDINLEFYYKVKQKLEKSDSVKVQWFDGSNWNPVDSFSDLKTEGWKKASYPLLAADNLAGFKLRFKASFEKNGNGDKDVFWLDCVKLTGIKEPTTGTITVTKVVENGEEGEAEVSNFNLYIGDTPVTSGDPNILSPGTYIIKEDNLPDYTAVYNGDCDPNNHTIILVAGEDKTCIITNTYVPPPENPGSITVCKIITDSEGEIIDGLTIPGVTFTIPGITPSPETSQGTPVGQIPDSIFTTPIALTDDLVNNDKINDAVCVTYNNLELGGYYYGEETISSDNGEWEIPKYNDQFIAPVTDLTDFFSYSGELFDGDPSNNGDRKTDADGHVVLNSGRSHRTLVVLNQLKPALKISASKVICNDESDLPNWGAVREDGNPITKDTAQDWIIEHPNCHLAENWEFEWAYEGILNPGDNKGLVDNDWNTFDMASPAIITDLQGSNKIWVREVFQDGYIPFSGSTEDPYDNVSAEFYCYTDVLNYDNYDYIASPTLGETYYCIGFNAPTVSPEEPVCGNGIIEEGEECDPPAISSPLPEDNSFCSTQCKIVPIYNGNDSCPEGTEPELINSYSIGAQDTDGETIPVEENENYLFTVSKTFRPTSPSGWYADAGYSTQDNWSNLAAQYGIYGIPPDLGAHALLGNLGQGIGIINWGNYNPDHTYSFLSNIPTSSIQFVIGDRYDYWFNTKWDNQGGMSDNEDSLTLDVYKCTPILICDPGVELLQNGGFETPEVTNTKKWDIFPSDTPSLQWLIEWFDDNGGFHAYGDQERPELANLELHRGVNGWLPSEGSQYAELDTDWDGPDGSLSGEPASVDIFQQIPTIPGKEYKLTFDFSPRPGQGMNENWLQAFVDGSKIFDQKADGTTTGGQTSWSNQEHSFTAQNDITTIKFRDTGTANSLGTFLDNVSLRCVGEPDQTECNPGDTQSCTTVHPGICSAGTQTCNPEGVWGQCIANNNATFEDCDNDLDDDCDGLVDYDDPDCQQGTTTTTTTTPTTSAGTTGGGGTAYPGQFAPPTTSAGRVLGAAVERGKETGTCSFYLLKYIKLGADNDPFEVKKLQLFLNWYQNANLEVTGIYDQSTYEAVKEFQLACSDEILQPWVEAGFLANSSIPTGYVYRTTQRWINLIVCPPLGLPMPDLSDETGRYVGYAPQGGVVAGAATSTPETTGEEETSIGETTTTIEEEATELTTEPTGTSVSPTDKGAKTTAGVIGIIIIAGIIYLIRKRKLG